MSVFCPKCGKKTFNEYVCDMCGYKIKEEKVIKNNWKPPKPNYRISNQAEENITINKNTILVIGIAIIAIALAYIAYTKYQERVWMEELVGTTNPKEFKRKLNKEIQKQLDIQNKALEEAHQAMNKALKNINTIKIPKFDNKSNEYIKYLNANKRLKRELNLRNIDYRTILKQKMHKYKNLNYIEREKKTFEILKRLIKNNY